MELNIWRNETPTQVRGYSVMGGRRSGHTIGAQTQPDRYRFLNNSINLQVITVVARGKSDNSGSLLD